MCCLRYLPVAILSHRQTHVALKQETPPIQRSQLYPQHLLPIIREISERADRFDLLRERMLLPYHHNTARAYWGDLEHWRDWCQEQGNHVDSLHPTSGDIERYLREILDRGYSPNTAARRLTALRGFFNIVIGSGANPARVIPPIVRRPNCHGAEPDAT